MQFSGWVFVASCFAVAATFILAQPPIRPDRDANSGATGDLSSFVARMMTFDANHDGKLSKSEITDSRLVALFERADDDHNGVVTVEELNSLYKKEASSLRRGGPGPGFGGPGGFGPPPIGQVLPFPLQEMLQLNADQRQQLDELQKQVDSSLDRILTETQRQQMQQWKDRGPGGFGPPPGGPGRGRGGPPPEGRHSAPPSE